MKKPILAHGLNDQIITHFLTFSNEIITFDDGLASLYKYKEELYQLSKKNTIILFINPFIVKEADFLDINIEFIECFKAHELALKNDFSHFLNTKMIKKLSKFCKIGLHGWDHFLWPKKCSPSRIKCLIEWYKDDVKKSWKWFESNFPEFKIKKTIRFAWPYNQEIELYKIYQDHFYKKLNKNIKYYGAERLSGWWNYYEKGDLNV